MIDAGKLDRRATFQAATETSDGGGGAATTWSDQFIRWAALALSSLRVQQEALAAGGAIESTTRATLTVYADSETETIDAGWRVIVAGRIWNVREVRPAASGLVRMAIESGAPT